MVETTLERECGAKPEAVSSTKRLNDAHTHRHKSSWWLASSLESDDIERLDRAVKSFEVEF